MLADNLKKKILDPNLRAFASSNTDEVREALIELDNPDLMVKPISPSDVLIPRNKLKASKEPIEDSPSKSLMDKLEDQLRALDVLSTARFEHAEKFLVHVIPAQLRQIADMPLVGKIFPNREHRISQPEAGR